MDAYLLLLTVGRENEGTTRYPGDIQNFQSMVPSQLERTGFYTIRITNVPDARFGQIRSLILCGALKGSGTNIYRWYSLGGQYTRQQVIDWIQANFAAAVWNNVKTYFKNDVEQPVDKILSLAWTSFKTFVRHRLTGQAPTDADIGDFDPVVTP